MPRYITKAVHEKWSERINELRREVREVCGDINEAAKLGDLRENAEYQYSVERRDRLMQEMKDLDETLQGIRSFIEDLRPDDGVVEVGTKVKIVREDEEEFEYAILGCSDDISPKGGKVVPYEAPIARQLLGKKLGEITEISIPAWTMDVEIVEIEKLFH